MEPRSSVVVRATAAAVVGALAAIAGGPFAAAVVGAVVAVHAVWRGAGPLLLALPAALGALAPPPAALSPPPPGLLRVEATVVDGPFERPHGRTTFDLELPQGRALFVAEHGLTAEVGDRLVGVVRVEGAREDGAAILSAGPGAVHVERGAFGPGRALRALRAACRERLLAIVDGRSGPLMCHLVLGRGPAVDPSLTAAHRATGLSHLLAVSGAHASLLAVLLGAAHGFATRRRPLSTSRSRLVCAVLLLGYGLLTGLEPPVFRAVAAFVLWLWARQLGRRLPAASALAGPAALTALFAPADLTSVSFCLSYAAVFGLVLAGAPGRGFVRRWLLAPLVASVWATLTTTPWTLWYFGQCTPWTVLATPLLAPLVGALLALGLVALVVPPLGPVLGPILTNGADLYGAIVEAIATLPAAPIHAFCSPDPVVVGALAVLGGVAIWLRPRRGTVAVACIAAAAPHFVPPFDGPSRLMLLPVGHGQACVVQFGATTTLVDCGSLGDARRAARLVVAAIAPRRRVDLVVVTHADADHWNGIPHLLESVPVKRAWLPRALAGSPLDRRLRAAGVVVATIDAGSTFTAESLTATLPPVASLRSNDHSLWVHVRFASFTALVTGDAEADGTAAWLATAHAGPADVLVLPHHGRKNANVEALLDTVAPRLALVSDGARDAPPPQATAARARGIHVLRTGTSGAITLLDGKPPTVATARPPPFLEAMHR